MASNSFGLFVQQLSAADDELRVQITYIIYDLLILHDNGQMVSGTLPVSRLWQEEKDADTLKARSIGRTSQAYFVPRLSRSPSCSLYRGFQIDVDWRCHRFKGSGHITEYAMIG
jgi:hypothetical protein